MNPSPAQPFRQLGALFAETGKAWLSHKAPRMGAALSYYTAFSLGPLLVFLFSIASLFWNDKASAKLNEQLSQVLPAQSSGVVQEILEHAATARTASWGAVISFVILLFGASGAFGELQDALNEIWEVPPQKQAFLAMIRSRALSFAMVFILGFFMFASFIVSALTAVLEKLIAKKLIAGNFAAIGFETGNSLISFLVIACLFATIFRLLPNAPLCWRDVIPGAVLTTFLFILGKTLLGWYIGFSTATFSSYGAAGSFVIILLWVYYSAQILYLGAEFTRAYTKRYGSLREQTA